MCRGKLSFALFKGRIIIRPYIHASLCPQGMGGYMKIPAVAGYRIFMLCCVRWTDMAVISHALYAVTNFELIAYLLGTDRTSDGRVNQ